jgi:hypothetical protein
MPLAFSEWKLPHGVKPYPAQQAWTFGSGRSARVSRREQDSETRKPKRKESYERQIR